ncbi:MAG: lytic transglycosylase domain-containing protein [Prevotella sp.]|nr:lytic transglycosylase domain-containing protein [Prevotella sp.]MBQ8714599.1 lytic transglycosylase domain-containing protein [Prevotella sp.]
MIKVVRKMVFTAMILAVGSVESLAGTNGKGNSFDWNPVINAIIQVESGGNPRAVSGPSCGAMQITPICVKECNLILEKRKSKKRFTMNDRFDVQKSKEMFLLIQSFFNRANDVEHAIRSWNGGQRYSKRATQRYYEKVMRHMK